MLTFPDVLDLLAHELSGLGRRSLALAFGPSRSLHRSRLRQGAPLGEMAKQTPGPRLSTARAMPGERS
jgi:hypothetical protein